MRRRGSLRRSLVLLSVGVLVLYYVLVLVFSALFMEPYYLHNVEKSLIGAYETLRAAGEYDLETVSALEARNISIVIGDRETLQVLYSSRGMPRGKRGREETVPEFVRYASEMSDTGYNIIADEMQERTLAGAQYSSGQRVALGGVTDLYVIELSTSYASVAQSATISLQFSLIVGLMVMVLAILAFSRVSTSVVGPITQITDIAGQIAKLDFSQTCRVDRTDEIGAMAESVNTMSDFMQSYIMQLQAANEQLKADIQQKKEQEEARKNLVANLSHDLKTPIGLISGYADGLRSGMAKSEQEIRDYCDVISDESDRMMEMILRMMELFRLESGTVQLEKEEFDLADLLSYLTEIFAVEIERSGIAFTASFAGSMYVYTDYFAAEQVLTNYMQNAVSHIGEEKVLSLSAFRAGENYRVEIFNSAAPIPEEEIPRLWDSFYRLDKSRNQRQSGLGLSIVKSNMELLGCPYGARNEPGGVVFWAEFPPAPEPE